MGLLYIALSVGCSLSIAHLLKKAKQQNARLIHVLSVNYLSAALISLTVAEETFEEFSKLPSIVLIVGVVLGILFIVNFFIYSRSLNKIGMGISIAAMRMSLVIPIGVSLIIYGESIEWIRYLGIALVFISLYLLIPKIKTKNVNGLSDAIYPILLFIFSGLADASLKVYESEFTLQLSEYGFLFIIFGSAFLAGLSILFFKQNIQFRQNEVFYGLMIGIANLYSSFFLIYALREMDGSLVFSLVNILNVVVGSLIGLLIWKDSLNKYQTSGIILAIISILLLII